MKHPFAVLVYLLIALAGSAETRAQEPAPAPQGCHWTLGCFPRCGCPDDYCPHPYPRPCWPPYPPFYRCVPAGNCQPNACGRGQEKLTWWFLPTHRALREALWSHP